MTHRRIQGSRRGILSVGMVVLTIGAGCGGTAGTDGYVDASCLTGPLGEPICDLDAAVAGDGGSATDTGGGPAGPCGGDEQPCCAGNTCSSDTLVCTGSGGRCVTCGQETAQLCCANDTCAPGGFCNENICVFPPPPGSNCGACVDGGCGGGLVCQDGGTCVTAAAADGGMPCIGF